MVNEAGSVNGDVDQDLIPPPIPPDVKPQVPISSKYNIMAWCGDSVKPPLVYKYSVKITCEDNRTIEGKGIGRELIDMVYRKYSHNFGGIKYVYDGEKALYTAVRLPQDRLEFTVVSEKASEKSEYGTTRSSLQSTTFTVELSYVAEIPLKSNALEVADVDKTQAKMGCLLVRQPFFHDESSNFADVGARVIGVRGFHSSFDGLSLNTEVYRKMIKTPGPVIDILMAKHGVLYRQILSKQVAKSMEEDADLPSSLVASQSGHASNGISDVKTSEAPKEKPIIMTEQPEISASAKAPHVFVTTTVKNPLGAKKTGKSGGLGARKLTTKIIFAKQEMVNVDVDQDMIPPPIPPNVKPQVLISPKYNIMARRDGAGTSGNQCISLLANHLQDTVKPPDVVLYKYSVSITSEDKRAVEDKEISRKLIDSLYETYSSELADTKFVYDEEKALYTVGPLPQKKLEFTVDLRETFAKSENDSPSEGTEICSRRCIQYKTFSVELSYAAKTPLKFQPPANMGRLQLRQPFFHYQSRNSSDVGAGVIGVRGFHSSFDGLSLNTAVSPLASRFGHVSAPNSSSFFADFGMDSSNPKRISSNSSKVQANKMLGNMRESNVIGISEKPCNLQYLLMESKSDDDTSEGETVDLPCLDFSKPIRPNYLPLEDDDSHGTTLLAIKFNNGYAICGDGRSNVKIGHERYSFIQNDTEDKVEDLSERVHVAQAGSKTRCEGICNHLRTQFGSYSLARLMSMPGKELDFFIWHAKKYMQKNPPNSKPAIMFVAGYSASGPEIIVLEDEFITYRKQWTVSYLPVKDYLAKNLQPQDEMPFICGLGSGSKFGKSYLVERKNAQEITAALSQNFQANEVTHLMMTALMKACLNDGHTGGLFKVVLVQDGVCMPKETRLSFELFRQSIENEGYLFDRSQLFFFVRKSIQSGVTMDHVRVYLKRKGFAVKNVVCMGDPGPSFSLYLVQFESIHDGQEFYSRCFDVNKGDIRFAYVGKETQLPVLVGFGSRHLLQWAVKWDGHLKNI